MSCEPIPDLPAAQVAAILAFARERGCRTAHYVGNADRALIEGLSALMGKDGVSIMDMPDRWKTGFAFWWDEREFPDTPCPERPDWLEGISSYQEGAPDCPDLFIHESEWSRPNQLARILVFRRRKHGLIPNLALLGSAKETRRLNSYEWHEAEGVLLASVSENSN
jgi:hypothetical protein